MKTHLASALASGLAAAAVLATLAFRSPSFEGIEIGADAPPLKAKTWFNHVGRDLEIDNLGGNAVLVEFWATW
jgi:hypothetical protein